jgi:hypothetical protein
MIGDKVFLIAKHVMTKRFLSPHEWQLKAFHYQSCGDRIFFNYRMSLDVDCLIDSGLISTIDLVTKFGLAL